MPRVRPQGDRTFDFGVEILDLEVEVRLHLLATGGVGHTAAHNPGCAARRDRRPLRPGRERRPPHRPCRSASLAASSRSSTGVQLLGRRAPRPRNPSCPTVRLGSVVTSRLLRGPLPGVVSTWMVACAMPNRSRNRAVAAASGSPAASPARTRCAVATFMPEVNCQTCRVRGPPRPRRGLRVRRGSLAAPCRRGRVGEHGEHFTNQGAGRARRRRARWRGRCAECPARESPVADEQGSGDHADGPERVTEDLEVGTLDVQALAGGGVQQRQAHEVDDQAERAHEQHRLQGRRPGVIGAVHGLDHDVDGHAQHDEHRDARREDFEPIRTERAPPGRVRPCGNAVATSAAPRVTTSAAIWPASLIRASEPETRPAISSTAKKPEIRAKEIASRHR